MLSACISVIVFLYNVLYLRNNKTLRALNQLDGSTERAVKFSFRKQLKTTKYVKFRANEKKSAPKSE